jgi:hypothetical protein
MSKIPKYKISPSDNDDWFIIELLDKKIKIDVEKCVLTTRFHCVPHPVKIQGSPLVIPCSRYCCYMGCYITPIEIRFIEEYLPELKSYLTNESREVLKKYKDEFYLPEDHDPDENLYKTRCYPEETTRFYYDNDVDNEVIEEDEKAIIEIEDDLDEIKEGDDLEAKISEIPDSSCLFLMENGLCAIHKFCDDHQMDWTIHKFNICTTFPVDIRVARNKTAKDAPYPLKKRVDDDCSTIKMMDDFEDFLYTKMNCVNSSSNIKAERKIPFIIDSMKYAIVSRFGEDLWTALKHHAIQLQRNS